jgi:hypothetical protein
MEITNADFFTFSFFDKKRTASEPMKEEEGVRIISFYLFFTAKARRRKVFSYLFFLATLRLSGKYFL